MDIDKFIEKMNADPRPTDILRFNMVNSATYYIDRYWEGGNTYIEDEMINVGNMPNMIDKLEAAGFILLNNIFFIRETYLRNSRHIRLGVQYPTDIIKLYFNVFEWVNLQYCSEKAIKIIAERDPDYKIKASLLYKSNIDKHILETERKIEKFKKTLSDCLSSDEILRYEVLSNENIEDEYYLGK